MRYALTTAVLVLLLAAGCSSGSTSETGGTGAATATTAATTETTTEATTEATATTEAATGTMTDTNSTGSDTGATGAMTDTGAMSGMGAMTGTGAAGATGSMAGATAHAELMAADGTVVGMAHFTETEGVGVTVQVDVTGIAGAAAGDHGIHVHMVGACDPPDFTSAGEHFNPTNMKHGLNNPEGPHAGDMPNITLDDQGSGTFSATSMLFTLGQGVNSLLDADGSALVIHADTDDQVTDPSGNSGARLACGVIMADTMAQ